jgi:signal transduction histidine kinase
MKTLLKILHLEDHPDDTALVQSALKTAGITCATTCVQSRADFVAALEGGDIDLVLSDHSLPGFDGLAATELMRARWPEIPVILVSGMMGEEQAIDALKNGATDYVLKDRLVRLAPAVRRAMQEVESRADRRQLQAQFIEAQKMEVIGQLAAGIAHDFNNILGVISGNLDLITFELAEDSPLREYAEEIRHASERAAGLTRQLLIFSRKETIEPVVLDLNEVVQKMDKMLRRVIGEVIVLTLVPGGQLGRVKADAGYVGQVVLNLVVNARDAMPHGGRLTLSTENVLLEANATRASAVAGEYVMLQVSDTGQGMTAEVKRRLFEPFFTTKAASKGTGLGLATCHNIVQQCGGFIEVQSEPGQGTTFKIYFPRIDQPLTVAAAPAPTGPLPRGTERLLLVEDDQSLRIMARRILQAQGYELLTAANGLEALQVVNQHQGPPIRLVVTDVVMPQMGGLAMAEWLKATDPELKILFTSGYTDEAIAKHGVLDAGMAFLPKPYTPAMLAGKVRAMLAGRGGTAIFRKPVAPNPLPNPLI